MEFEFIVFLCSILFFASLIHGSVGFGFPMIATPLIALYTDLQTAIIYTLIPTLLVNIVSIKSEGSFLQAIKKFYGLALYAAIGSFCGTFLLIYFNSDFFKVILALAILFYLLLDFVKFEFSWVKQKAKLALGVFGLSAGLLGGLTNAMAPVLIIYTLESKFDKKEIIQASNICFLSGKIIQIILFTFVGGLSFSEFTISSFTLLIIALSMFLGVKIKNRINAKLYMKIIKLLLLFIAISLIFKTFVP